MINKTGSEVRRGPVDLDHNVRGQPQPPAPAGGDGDGINHVRSRDDAAFGFHVELRWADEPQLPRPDDTAVLDEHGHDLGVGAVPHRHVGPDPDPEQPASPAAAAPGAIRSSVDPQRRCRGAGRAFRGGNPSGDRAGAVQPIQIGRPSHVGRRSPHGGGSPGLAC